VTPRGQGEDKVYRITGAPRSHTEDINRRINRYLVSMTIRTVCVVLIFVLHGPGRWVAAAGAIFLPWVAVMMANAADRRTTVQLPPILDHRALGTAAQSEPTPPTVLDGEVVTADGAPADQAPTDQAPADQTPTDQSGEAAPTPAAEASPAEDPAPTGDRAH
jgi:hypothetical protein